MLGRDGHLRRVLMTADAVGGIFTYALDAATELARAGVATTLAVMGDPLRPEQRIAAREVPLLSVEQASVRLEWMDDPWEDVARAKAWLLDLAARDRPDIVHLNGYAHAGAAFDAPRIVVAHSCVLSWWKAVFGEAAPARYARYKAEVERGLASADIVVAPTHAMLSSLRENYDASFVARVIPNGARRRAAARVPKEPFVLAAGRLWDQAKNVSLLDRIAPSLGWPLFVAGDARAPRGANGDGAPDRDQPGSGVAAARTLGFLDRDVLRGFMARASIFAHPARYEPFGLGVLEAAQEGCALVLGDIPSLREVWADAALFVAPDDERAWTARIAALTADPGFCSDFGARARQRARAFSVERAGLRLLGLYRELASREHRTCA